MNSDETSSEEAAPAQEVGVDLSAEERAESVALNDAFDVPDPQLFEDVLEDVQLEQCDDAYIFLVAGDMNPGLAAENDVLGADLNLGLRGLVSAAHARLSAMR